MHTLRWAAGGAAHTRGHLLNVHVGHAAACPSVCSKRPPPACMCQPSGSPVHGSAGVLFLSPLIAGFTLSRLIASPMLDSIEAWNPRAFELSDNQKVEGFHEVKKAELRIRMEAALGRAPPLKGGPLLLPDVSMGMASSCTGWLVRCCG